MKHNENNVDRALRAVLGLVLCAVALGVGATSLGGILLLVVALVLMVTAAIGFCPLYAVLGINTCPVRTTDAGAATQPGHGERAAR